MKKFIISILFIIFVFASNAQSRLNYSEGYIKAEFPQLTVGWVNDSIKVLSLTGVDYSVFYYFTSKNICYSTIIVPNNKFVLDWFIEKYNSTYVIVNDSTWNMYDAEAIAQIELLKVKNNYLIKWTNAN